MSHNISDGSRPGTSGLEPLKRKRAAKRVLNPSVVDDGSGNVDGGDGADNDNGQNDGNGDGQGGGDSSDSDSSEPRPKRAKLPVDMPVAIFDSLFTHSSFKPKKKRDTAVFFPVESQPTWIKELGDSFLNEQGTWELKIPDHLVAHVAGHKGNLSNEFTIFTNTNLLQDMFSLINCSMAKPPNYPKLKRYPFAHFNAVKACIKALSLSFVTASKLYAQSWQNVEVLEHLIFPSVYANMEALRNSVKALRHSVLPATIPYYLRCKFVDAPLSSIWPSDETILNPLRQFFRTGDRRRGSSFQRGRGRGSSRGRRSFRTQSNRGFSRGRGRRGRRGGSQADSVRVDNSHN